MTSDFASLKPLAQETPSAYQAFTDYIHMGESRSIRDLQETYVERKRSNPEAIVPSVEMTTLFGWSTTYEWQRRLKDYLEEMAVWQATKQRERLEKFNERVWRGYEKLAKKVEDMMETVEQQKITRRQRVPDPQNSQAEIEVIRMRVNTSEMHELVRAFGQLGKDLRVQLGLPTHLDVTSKGERVKGYSVTASPEDWDTDDKPAADAD
jgi:hypothetical protein